MPYPNTDYLRVGLSPRWVFAVLSAPTTIYLTGATVAETFTAIAGDSAGFTVTSSISSVSEIVQQCDWFSGLQAASGFEVQLQDVAAEYSDLINSDPQSFIGKEVVLYIYFAQNTPASLTANYEVWRGFVDDFSFDESSLKVSCRDSSLSAIENKKIPSMTRLIEEGTYVPSEVVGKIYPIIYGEVNRSPIIMTKDRRDKIIHIGICTAYTAATKVVDVTWISATFPTINSLANTYLKVVYGTDKSADLTGDPNDDSLIGAIKKIVSNTNSTGVGVGTLTLDTEFPEEMRDWINSDQGVVFEILDADMEYSAWRILSTDNFAYEGFQAENSVDSPAFLFDTESKDFLQLDSTQYQKTTSSVGGHTLHIIDFDVSYLIGRDQLNLIVDYIELDKIFATNGSHSIQQFDAGVYTGHEYANEDNSIDDDLTSKATLNTGGITNQFNFSSIYKEIHWDLLYLYKYLQQTNREQLKFSKVYLTIKLDWNFDAVSGACIWSLELRALSYDRLSNEAGNTPPTAAHILQHKFILSKSLGSGASDSGSIYALPAYVDSVDGDDDTYRDIRLEFESVTQAVQLANKHAALILRGGGTSGSRTHIDIIDIYSVGITFERQIALADAKEFYGNIKGRKDFASDALISAGTYQEHPFFCVAHALIAENGFTTSELNFDFSDSVKFAFTMLDQMDTTTFLENAATQTGSKILVDKSGIWTNDKYDSTKTFKVSGTNTPADLDIFDQKGSWNTGTGKFTIHPILDINDIKLTPTNDCYSNFVVQYNYNHGSNKFDSMLYMYSDGTTNLVNGDLENHTVADLQALIAASPADSDATIKLELDFVRDQVTAGTVVERYITRLHKRWWSFTFKTWWSAFEYDIGDIVNVRHDMLTKLFPGTVTTKRWEIVEKTLLTGGGVDLTVVEN